MQSRQLVWAEHVVHAGCDGSLGNLTGCIEVLAATCAAAAAAVAAAAATLSMTFVASMHGGSGAPRNQCVCGWCGQGMRSMQDATARLGTWLDASKCCYFPLCYCCCHAERDACCIFEGEGAVARARHGQLVAAGAGGVCGTCKMRRLAQVPDRLHWTAVTPRPSLALLLGA